MGDKSRIEWCDASLFGGPLPKRCSKCRCIKPIEAFGRDVTRTAGYDFVCRDCRYQRKTMGTPGKRERIAMRAEGLAWCRGCRAWLDIADVSREGVCRPCANREERQRYANDAAHRERRRNHRDLHRRGVERMPLEAAELLKEMFDGECAYCQSPATTWDHFVPVAKGGLTEPGNMLPACRSCNSRKKDRDPEAWLASAPAVKLMAIEYLALAGALE